MGVEDAKEIGDLLEARGEAVLQIKVNFRDGQKL
jgi:hypothetical protein